MAALPDPAGTDRSRELITLINTSATDIDLTGWALADATGQQALTGTIAAGTTRQIPTAGTVQLGNRGDAIVLTDPTGTPIDQVSYKTHQVRPGRTICFGR